MLVFKIKKVIDEAPDVKSYVIEHKLNAKPGQFVMVWMPGVDEVPMSIGLQTDTEFTLSIAKAGDCTALMHEKLSVGDKIGIRGPFGKPFTFEGKKNIVLVGGGCGTPPMLNLAQVATAKGIKTTVLLGGRTSEHLLFEKTFKELGCEIKVATDDGSKGHKGYVTDLLKKELEKGEVDCVYTCGPELMMVTVARLAQDFNIPSQVSLERFMKCGFGICGQCCIDGTGLRVCKDGPVFDGEIALKHQEFGKYKRDSAGLMIGLDGCALDKNL
ncbi:dihydroorotate dehydrogenase electron transfer subunit [Candidatus Peregrinibacteria bacterium]|nr:dihydroorotate dehydrogenase electron transfer subunit [Candidatus Peregrinibacteria bacterium]